MSKLSRRFFMLRSFLLIGVLVLSGCQANGPARYQPKPKTVNLVSALPNYNTGSNSMGMVVARVIHAGGVLPTLNFMTLTPKNYNTSDAIQKQRLEAVDEDMDRSNLFAGQIEPGTYSLSSMRAFYVFGYSFFSQFVPLDATFGTFEVKAGQVTDLGVLVYYPKSEEDKFVHTLLRLDAEQPGKAVSQHFPKYNYDPQAVLGWQEDELADQRYEQYINTVQNPVSFNHRFKAADGTIYFLSGLGVMVNRASDGQWSMDAVETNFKLNTMAESASGDLLVGGDGGSVFYKTLNGEWRDISIDVPVDVDSVNFRDNVIEVAARTPTTAEIYRATLNKVDGEGNIEWRKIITYSGSRGWLNSKGERLNLPGIPKKRGRNLTNIVSVDNDTKLNRVTINIKTKSNDQWMPSSDVFTYQIVKDVASDAQNWLIQTELEAAEVETTFDAGAVTMGIRTAGFWSWDGKPDYLIGNKDTNEWTEMTTKYQSCPSGHLYKEGRCSPSESYLKSRGKKSKKSKKSIKAPRQAFYFVSPPMFFTANEGVAIVKDKTRDNGRGNQQIKPARVLMTFDGGISWLLTNNKLPNDYCYQLEVLVTDRLLLSCDGASGDFYESMDRGKTWQHTRESQSF